MPKMQYTYSIVYLLVMTGLTALSGCSFDNLAGGGGSDAGNGIIMGRIATDNGLPATRTLVVLVPSYYNPANDTSFGSFPTDTTNEKGEYELNAPRHIIYNLLAVYEANSMRALIRNIPLIDDTVRVVPDTLKWPGAVAVDIGSFGATSTGYVYIPGTKIAAFFNAGAGYVTLDSVPAGIIPVIYYKLTNFPAGVLRYDVRIPPGKTIVVENLEWKHSVRLYLNTTVSGAQVYSTVTDFPLLVRLTKNNFNFEKAKADGGDIRFTKSDNTPLPYEIERWDCENRKAEIWVKADTVYGNNSTQYVMMYWGNENAPNLSDGAAVFDTADDYAAVWHLNKNCDDATGNENKGNNYGAADSLGIAGMCKYFDGNDYIKINGLLGTPSNISLSAWVQLDAISIAGHEAISLGDAVLIRVDDRNIGTMGASFTATGNNEGEYTILGTGHNLKYTGWHFVSYSINTTEKKQTFYIDGVQCCCKSCFGFVKYACGEKNTFIGRHALYAKYGQIYNYVGKIDEVRVCRKARGPDWMRLCYMNQKSRDVLLSMDSRSGNGNFSHDGGAPRKSHSLLVEE